VYSKKESKTSFELRTLLISKDWFVRKLHGNLWQIGLPDLLVSRRKDGKIMLIELKQISKPKSKYTQADIIGLLQGPQTGVVLILSRIRAPVFVVVQTPKGWMIAGYPIKKDEICYHMTIEELYEILNER